MKNIFLLIFIFVLASCSKDKQSEVSLAPSDVAAVSGMTQESNNLRQATNELVLAGTPQMRHHWDSAFDYHDSMYWHHHQQYNDSNNHPHNDHHHQWVPYDPGIDHTHHYHHVYPGHPHDSMIVVPNGHHTDLNTHHMDIHTIHDHHVVDSLNNVHVPYHP